MTIAALSCLIALVPHAGMASERYRERPPVVVSPDLSAPWVIQLGQKPGRVVPRREQRRDVAVQPVRRAVAAQPPRRGLFGTDQTRTAAIRAPQKRPVQPQINPIFLPQEVSYPTNEKPGTIVIDTVQNFLYLVEGNGKARRYGVGTGKPGFEWAGTHRITGKKPWPSWTPPAEMKARERAKGRYLPDFMPGGPDNPMGARALYIGSTLYRIHGTNQPWTIGGAVSSGCIRMRNEDVVDLYERVNVGAKVTVI